MIAPLNFWLLFAAALLISRAEARMALAYFLNILFTSESITIQ